MRLINTKTLQIEDFSGRKAPRYAILSHTWGNEELTFQDWLYVQNQSPPRWGWVQIPDEIQRLKSKEGYHKMTKACERARQSQHNSPACQWLWADTVCIDKSSSAELSEAINSMFEWYRRAEVCYAYLVDVAPMSGEEELSKCSQRTSPFRQSRWFRRGWTLQELIAPWSVIFLSKDWTYIGTKSTLAKHISTITTIPENCLSGNWPRIRDQTSIAQKMSWAAWRQTTRIEDRAYSLMGLFEINMPLLYGEGEKAFIRLQEEMIKQTEDLSFLAWKSDRSQTFVRDHFIHWKLPPLADSPTQFFSPRRVIVQKTGDPLVSRRVFTANTGVYIHRPLLGTFSPRFFFVALNAEARTLSRPTLESVWIPLVRGDRSALGGFSRSSFPVSTVVTTLYPARCRMHSADAVTPSGLPLQHLYEPCPERHYFRKRHRVPRSDGTAPTNPPPLRQVGILPVFANRLPWAKVIGSYPPIDQKDALIFNLAEAEGTQIYHGLLLFDIPLHMRHVNSALVISAETVIVFGVHFLASFGPEGDRPRFWKATLVNELNVDSSAADVRSKTESVTKSITAQMSLIGRIDDLLNKKSDPSSSTISGPGLSDIGDIGSSPAMEGAGYIRKRHYPGPARAHHEHSAVFAEMDSRWYTFRSAGLEEVSFDTHINLVMIAWGENEAAGT